MKNKINKFKEELFEIDQKLDILNDLIYDDDGNSKIKDENHFVIIENKINEYEEMHKKIYRQYKKLFSTKKKKGIKKKKTTN